MVFASDNCPSEALLSAEVRFELMGAEVTLPHGIEYQVSSGAVKVFWAPYRSCAASFHRAPLSTPSQTATLLPSHIRGSIAINVAKSSLTERRDSAKETRSRKISYTQGTVSHPPRTHYAPANRAGDGSHDSGRPPSSPSALLDWIWPH